MQILGKIEDYSAKSKMKSEPICADTSVSERRGRERSGRKWVGVR